MTNCLFNNTTISYSKIYIFTLQPSFNVKINSLKNNINNSREHNIVIYHLLFTEESQLPMLGILKCQIKNRMKIC
jgi:hypothetical protein